MNYYVHHIPGRLRVKIPPLKGDPEKGRTLPSLFEEESGIESITVNVVTGSVVMNYDPQGTSAERILGVLAQHGLFDGSKALTNDEYLHTAVSKAGLAMGKAVFGYALGKVFEGSSLSFLAMLI